EAIEITAVWSVAGLLSAGHGLVRVRPFRAPHHTTSAPGLIGGGSVPHPGEASLAHLGVLFLDELPEVSARVLESLRQPLEDGSVVVSRAAGSAAFPARFQLVGAANYCRRGCVSLDACVCTPGERQQYLSRLSRPLLDRIDPHPQGRGRPPPEPPRGGGGQYRSGLWRPLLDRIDLHLEVRAVPYAELSGGGGESSRAIRSRVEMARRRQSERLAGSGGGVNARRT